MDNHAEERTENQLTESSERTAWLRLAIAQGTGRPWAQEAVRAFGSAEAAAQAGIGELRAYMSAAKAREVAGALRRARPAVICRRAEDLEQQLLTPADPGWPTVALGHLADSPCWLFLRGRLPRPEAHAVAVVGTRDASPYGLRMAGALSADLAGSGVWIVSGFALGVDGAAHDATVAAGGRTLAVLGCGLDHDYPVAHGDLRQALAERGGLLTEHPPGVEPRRHHFPRRNRIVAALSAVVVVIEAAERSGALITARLALELGRDVLAVPGSVFRSGQAGCHRLIQQGAGLCTGADDVLEVLGLESLQSVPRPGPTAGAEAVIWRALDDEEAYDANVLCLRTGLAPEEVGIALTGLEMSGHARRLPGVGFLRHAPGASPPRREG